jgi:hypothetical protein
MLPNFETGSGRTVSQSVSNYFPILATEPPQIAVIFQHWHLAKV